jgi:hypothetical protein
MIADKRITVYEIPGAAMRQLPSFQEGESLVIGLPRTMPAGQYVEDITATLPDGAVRLAALADLTYSVIADREHVAEFAREYVPEDESDHLSCPSPESELGCPGPAAGGFSD